MVKIVKLNEKLIFLRKEKRLSQQELAEALEVSRQAVSRWESGDVNPSIENLKCLSSLYGVSIDDLLDTEGEWPRRREEVTEERTIRVTNKKQKKRKIGMILSLIIGVLIVSFIIYRVTTYHEKTIVPIEQTETDDWSNSGIESFSFGW